MHTIQQSGLLARPISTLGGTPCCILEMLAGDRHYKNAGWGPTIVSRKHLRVKSRATNSFPKSGAQATRIRVDLRSACSPPFAVPGIGESAGGETAQCFDPLTTRGFTRVERGRYPIWGCSGLQQHTRLPSRSRACREQGYTIDRGKDYRVERHQHDCLSFTDEASHRDRC